MKAELALGLRLAGLTRTGSWPVRWRSLSVFASGVIGCYLLLALAAVTSSEIAQRPAGIVEPGVQVLLATVVLVVVTPVVTLSATTARLAAATRDRRLAGLRLLGLSASRTRLVAASEVAAAALAGASGGAALFLATRGLLGSIHLAGRSWPASTLAPHSLAVLAAIGTVPLTVTVVAMLPRLGRSADLLRVVRRGVAPRPSLLRLVPGLAGTGLAIFVIAGSQDLWAPESTGTNLWLVPYLFLGLALLAAGTILAVPWLVRGLADLLVRAADRPVLLIAGRRLQAQPSGVTRIVAGLLAGLFLVTGARGVVVAFEDTAQYRSASLTETIGQIGTVTVARSSAGPVVDRLRANPDVAEARAFTLLESACRAPEDPCWRAYVGTCAELEAILPSVQGCRDGVVVRLQERDGLEPAMRVRSQSGDAAAVALPRPGAAVRDPDGQLGAAAVDGLLLVPPTTPGVARLVPRADVEVLVRAAPGVAVEDVLATAGTWGEGLLGGSYPDDSYFRFVEGLRALVWAIAVLVLATGLLAFGFSAIDRALNRHAEAVALQVLGVPPRVLRRSLWVEALVPLAVGSVLAVGLGLLAGSSYLAYGGILQMAPIRPALLLAATAMAGAVLASALIATMASPAIRPERIRTE